MADLQGEDFNPRSREGSDEFVRQISRPLADFNPRSREGSDADARHYAAAVSGFQSTLP